VASVGEVNEEIIARYIEDQQNMERDEDADFKVEE
jgi:predicted secreted Zn-dependent protease